MKLNKVQFVSTKDETMEMKVYSTPELQSEQPRTSIHQDEAREIDAPIAEAEGKVCCQAVTDSSDQLGKRPSAAQFNWGRGRLQLNRDLPKRRKPREHASLEIVTI